MYIIIIIIINTHWPVCQYGPHLRRTDLNLSDRLAISWSNLILMKKFTEAQFEKDILILTWFFCRKMSTSVLTLLVNLLHSKCSSNEENNVNKSQLHGLTMSRNLKYVTSYLYISLRGPPDLKAGGSEWPGSKMHPAAIIKTSIPRHREHF